MSVVFYIAFPPDSAARLGNFNLFAIIAQVL